MHSLFDRFFRPRRQSAPGDRTTDDVDGLIRDAFAPVRNADTDTPRQWARLHATLAATPERSAPAWRRPRVALAVSFAAVAVVAAVLVFGTRDGDPVRYATARGEQSRVLLSDSSEVTLNHTSELLVERFGAGGSRRMMLSGEALFHVRRNETPFVVSNGFAEVTVLGTEFNVRSRDGVLEVAVLHGTVRVDRGGTNGSAGVTLTPGQRALVRREEGPRRIEDIPSPEYPGWTRGKLFLTRASLDEACREVEARFDVIVRVVGPSTSSITGILEASSAETAMRSLSLLTGRQLRQDHGTFILE